MLAYRNKKLKLSGMMLIELMISLGMAVLLMSFLFEIFLANQRSDRLQMALYTIQDSAKNAIDILSSDIHKAGYIGCAYLSNTFSIVSYRNYSITSNNKLMGNQKNEMMIRYVDFPNTVLMEAMYDKSVLFTSQAVMFSRGDILVISDCKQAEIFEVKHSSSFHQMQKIITAAPLHHHYDRNAEIGKLVMHHYFIAKSKRKNQDGTPIYSLFVQDLNQRKTELIENINQMQILYTIKQDNKMDEKTASHIEDWSKVAGVSITLDIASFSIKKPWYVYVSL